MENIKDQIDIELIRKRVLSKLSDSEELIFDNWIKASSENEIFYKKVEYYLTNSKVHDHNEIDLIKSWTNVKKRLINAPINKNYKRLKIVSSVAASIIVLLSVFYFVESNKKMELADLKGMIPPGKQGAELILDNGKVVRLGSTLNVIEEKDGTRIRAELKEISYQTNKLSTSKMKTKEVVYNEIRVNSGEEYKILLADGTKVWVNSKSSVRFPVQFTEETRKVYIEGEAYFEVAKDENKPFLVYSGSNSIQVLGTEFNVRAYSNNPNTYVTLCEGSIELTTKEQSIVLKPNEQVVINNKGETSLASVNTTLYTAWKDGAFMYRNASLITIMEDLSRWYDTEIEIKDQETRDLELSLHINRSSDFYNILEIIAVTNKVEFDVTKNKIEVRKK